MSTEWMLSKDPTPKLCSMYSDITYHPMRESFILVRLIVPVSGPQASYWDSKPHWVGTYTHHLMACLYFILAHLVPV